MPALSYRVMPSGKLAKMLVPSPREAGNVSARQERTDVVERAIEHDDTTKHPVGQIVGSVQDAVGERQRAEIVDADIGETSDQVAVERVFRNTVRQTGEDVGYRRVARPATCPRRQKR